ncbi:MAG: AtpZ/AtpI family protein [Candidatus Gracilibacteria bacterium]|nr:AtpZ/AtpI family protein [Candidatus Gracilibacteria bacterium]
MIDEKEKRDIQNNPDTQETKENKQTKQKSAMWLALDIAYELGYLIALPIVVLGFGGAFLDKKFGTSPLFILSGIVLSFIITSVGAYRKIKDITDKINSY